MPEFLTFVIVFPCLARWLWVETRSECFQLWWHETFYRTPMPDTLPEWKPKLKHYDSENFEGHTL